jgi:two-component system response regulator GlrR
MPESNSESRAKILVVDDEPNIRDLIKMRLVSLGYEVIAAAGGAEARAAAAQVVLDMAIIDLKLGAGEDGLQVMEQLFLINPQVPVIILTAHGSIENAVDAIKKGAYSYLTKPYKPEELAVQVKNALEKQRLTKEVTLLKVMLQERFAAKNIVGQSPQMKEILSQVERAAQTDATIVLYGESGTGKELIAQIIHLQSRRSRGPFVALNCGAIPEGLLENELFGHTRGAYTDAREAKMGLFTQADKGTLLLDEIGDTSPALQVKLLRVLQEKEFKPLGGERSVKVDVRVIVASNKNLQEAVARGTFREDLFYRIQVVPIYLPPLRERKEDIPPLVEHFIKHYSKELGKEIKGITPAAMQRLMLYPWPGNIRELKNVLERAVILTSHNLIDEQDLLHMTHPAHGLAPLARDKALYPSFKIAKEEFEKGYLIQVLTQARGNVVQAAKLAQRYRGDVYRLMKKYGLKAEDFK